MAYQETLQVATSGRGTYEITADVQATIGRSGTPVGLCHVFVQHTSASLIICENADPTVRSDLERFMARAVPDGDPIYDHTLEGPDDMPAHVRSILTNMDLTVPVSNGRCALGTWQGIYLYEHRHHAQRRRVVVTVRD
ncbi:MAG: secondary thiamine-phosphate synthase enzyme YjbQ [Gammaproteobacteria bacterium]|nr:secondary thiamine-phosphate synthase enzyme YjbQ [Gammaproteobacteria bacterium]